MTSSSRLKGEAVTRHRRLNHRDERGLGMNDNNGQRDKCVFKA